MRSAKSVNAIGQPALSRSLCHQGPILFGGTFSPPHKGHMRILSLCRAFFPDLHILIVPSYHTPFKRIGDMLPFDVRMRLLDCLLEDYKDTCPNDRADAISVCGIEGEIRRQVRTWQLVEMLAERLGFSKRGDFLMRFACGDDVLQRLDEWSNAQYLKKHVEFIVFRRLGADQKEMLDKKRRWLLDHGYRMVFLNNDTLEASSSDVNRGMLGLLSERVEKEMMRLQIYR